MAAAMQGVRLKRYKVKAELAAHNRKYRKGKFTVAFLVRARVFFIGGRKSHRLFYPDGKLGDV